MIIKIIEIIFITYIIFYLFYFLSILIAEKGNESAEVEGLFGKKDN